MARTAKEATKEVVKKETTKKKTEGKTRQYVKNLSIRQKTQDN